MKHLFLALLAGLLYALSFPLYSFWPLAWVWAVPLLLLMEELEGGELFLYGMASGLVAWAGLVYWVAYVMNYYGGMGLFPAAFLLLVLISFLSLFFGAFAWLGGRFIHSPWAFVLIPGAWVLIELVRSYVPFSGFPWGLLGYSQFPFKPFIQIAEIGGVYLVSAVLMMANVAIYHAVRKRAFFPVLLCLVVVVNCILWGAWRRDGLVQQKGSVRAAVAQANVDQDEKWSEAMVGPTVDTYVRLTRAAVKDGARIVVWPETSCPFFLFLEWPVSNRIIDLSKSVDARLVVGSPAFEHGQYYNRIWLMEKGEIGGYYDKVHLVPFGEYLPLAGLIEPFFSGLTKEVGNFSTLPRIARPIGDMGVTICFETVFPGMSRDLCNKGAAYLVNNSNDAWFRTWSTPEQLLEMACFRSIENRRWQLRAVNHGISAIISPCGDVVKRIGLLKEGYTVADISREHALTLYTRFGPVIAFIWAGISALAALALTRHKPKC